MNVAAITLGLAVFGASTASAQEAYTVESGDTLFSIASAVDGVSWQDIAANNADEISDPDLIYVGQSLHLTGNDTAAATSETSSTPSEPASSGNVATSTWDAIAQCESTGNWSINTGNGYYGGLQFTLQSWNAVGGSGMPNEASKDEQIARAEQLLELQGWNAWPECSSQLGLR